MIYERCLRCNRKLKSEDSKKLGFGKTCWEKTKSESAYKELFPLPKPDCLTNNRGETDAGEQFNNDSQAAGSPEL